MRKLTKSLLTLGLLASLLARPAAAQTAPAGPAGGTVRFQVLTIEDGLSQNAGLALLQDRAGFLWIGTQDGLNRYDGYTFTVFKNDPADPASLSYNSVLALLEDRAGRLWVGTWGGGLNRLDPTTGAFTRFQPDPADPAALSHGIVTSLLEDSAGVIWVGTLGGLDRFDPETGAFTHFRHDPADPRSLSADAVSVLHEDARGVLWVGTGAFSEPGAGLNRFEPATGTFTRFQHDPADPGSLAGDNIADLAEDPAGRLWVATGGYSLPGAGLDVFDPGTGQVGHYRHDPADPRSLSSDDVFSLAITADGQLWAGTWSAGLNQMALDQPGRFTRYLPDPRLPHSLSGAEVWSLLPDRSGVLWVGTAHSGLNKLTPHSRQFRLFQHQPDDPASLAGDAVGAFAEDQSGAVWVGTWGSGLDRFDPSAGTFAHFRHDPAQPASLSNDLVMSLHVDGQGAVWAGTLGSGLDRLDPRAGTITHFPPDPADPLALADGNVTAIASDAAGRLWVGTFAGLHRLDPGAAGFVRYAAEPARPAALSHAQVVSLLPAPDGSLWIGTWGGGLNRLDLNDPASLDPAAARFTRYQHVAGDPASLSEDSVWAIHRTADGRLWLGTQGGLNRFDPATGAFRAYREAEGLRNATVLGVMEDAAGALWVTTNNGLARFDPQVERFTLYDSSDGLASNEFNSGAWLRTRAGQLYVGGGRGFNVFEPAALQPGRLPPPVALTDFKIFNTSVRRAPAAPITLAHDQDFIAFEFAALDYSAPARNVYAYQLEGYDADWIQAGPRRYASYTNLPGGSYTLRVRAANGDGVWNEAGLAVPVTVTPPIWETWWFRGLGLAALALAGFGLFQARVYTIRAQNRQLESVVRVRTAELEETNRRLAREVEQRQRAEAALARRAAQELEQAEARFRVMFEHSAIGMGLLALDRRLLQVNPAVCRMSGYSPAELLALDPVRLWPAEESGLDAALFRELAAGQRETYAFERRFVRKDGSGFWGRLNYSLVRGADGAPQYIFGTLENIDAQRAALAELTASEARFRAVFESASVGVALMGLDRRVFSANLAAQRLTGYSAEELRQINTSDLAVEADRALGRAEFEDLVAGRRDQYLLEKRYRRKDGSVYWGRVNFSAVRDAAGGVQYLAGLIEDITETKEAEARLAAQAAEAQRTLERRIAERTAELNQANALLQQKAAQEAVASERTRLARDLHDAVTQTLFAATLIAEVLPQVWRQSAAEGERRLEELRQLTRGALAEMRTLLVELRPNALVEIPLGALLRQLTEAVTGRARLPIQLSVEGDRALPADVQVALYRIAQEALNNAVKHARASQAFVTARLGPVVRLTIADNGAGFDAAAVPAGHLGLQIMRERAESVGAKFSLYSERGEGTQISVTWEAGT